MLDALRGAAGSGDDAARARMAQAELAFRMQVSVPEVADLSDEPDSTFELYGEDARRPGSYAANCLIARRLIERDVRFVQLIPPGLGSTREPAGRDPHPVQGDRPGVRGAGHRPEAPRAARRHAGDLGR